ncbi:hypothetical protein NSK_004061 [Nannochloropsis salina CCMP1776]|uniref:Uncharacterized protein n=1 Tax=Nannochloropsis salina CCMP1776 TaxID=1027361 RepID=A0A4D9CZW0_9STRA|nr:hypothetical protein NSK_004061 [Nannochloropsis salina CCMP1776]|eukprot:TFJ84596.1 hypothetical protein NSK_004061 [Nannochloropsis salina CCMP1776]
MASFGVVCPGRPVMVDWRPINETKFVCEIASPAQVTDLTFFLLPNIVLPPGTGTALYYSLPPFAEWTVLGALTLDKPSGVFRTGWSTIEGIAQMPAIQLGVSLESLDTITNLDLQKSGVDERRLFAHKIAQDLWSFVCSFAQQTQQGGREAVLLPANAMDMWLERFDRKYRLDASFMFKTGN